MSGSHLKDMKSKYTGKCAGCGKVIHKGELIQYSTQEKLAFHQGCWEPLHVDHYAMAYSWYRDN